MEQKKRLLCAAAFIVCLLILESFAPGGDGVMTKEKDLYIVNTTSLGKNIEGNNGPTPLKIYIRKNKVERIEFLKHQETPSFYQKVKKALQNKWNGLHVKDAAKLKVDAVTGATFSSEAVIENMRLGLEYYQKHK